MHHIHQKNSLGKKRSPCQKHCFQKMDAVYFTYDLETKGHKGQGQKSCGSRSNTKGTYGTGSSKLCKLQDCQLVFACCRAVLCKSESHWQVCSIQRQVASFFLQKSVTSHTASFAMRDGSLSGPDRQKEVVNLLMSSRLCRPRPSFSRHPWKIQSSRCSNSRK